VDEDTLGKIESRIENFLFIISDTFVFSIE